MDIVVCPSLANPKTICSLQATQITGTQALQDKADREGPARGDDWIAEFSHFDKSARPIESHAVTFASLGIADCTMGASPERSSSLNSVFGVRAMRRNPIQRK